MISIHRSLSKNEHGRFRNIFFLNGMIPFPSDSRFYLLTSLPRVLIFASRQIWWNCRKIYSIGDGLTWPDHSHISLVRLRFLDLPTYKRERYNAWLSVVERYSERKLSFSKDKLLAISGIAEHYGKTTGGQYLAGHFASSFLSSLLWKTRSQPLPRPAEYRAPSWSWAAVDGQVKWEHSRIPTSSHLEFLGYDLRLDSIHAPYGAVRTCQIALRGRLRQVLWGGDQDCLLDPKGTEGSYLSYFAETIPDASEKEMTQRPIPVWCLEICAHDSSRPQTMEDDPNTGKMHYSKTRGDPKGLILRTEDGLTFRREGLFAFRDIPDLRVDRSKKEDFAFIEQVEQEKASFFDNCLPQVITII
jgi:hypothetical protein